MMRRLSLLIGSLSCVGAASLLSPTASAVTSPIAGAVSLPDGAMISLPFPEGYSVHVRNGYGPTGGSIIHVNTNNPGKANDYYAVDFTLNDYPNYGLGEPVLAIAPGTVVKAEWATSGWANYGQMVIIAHDFGDGHDYNAIYCHLNAIDVAEGDEVSAGQQIGQLGASCMAALSCDSFSYPHLHFAIHQDSLLGAGGPYAGYATVPEPISGYEDLVAGLDLIATASGEPPPPCQVIPPEGGILDDQGQCFTKSGTPSYWEEENAGWENHLWWTTATSLTADNVSRWKIYMQQASLFNVEVYTDTSIASSQQARYVIRHNGTEDTVVLNQAAASGWQSLGEFSFAAGADQWIRLEDNTGEAYSSGRKVVSDAIRFSIPGETPDAGTDDSATLPDTTALPDTESPDTTALPDTESPDTTALPDTESPDTTALPDTESPDTTTLPDTESPDTTTLPDTESPDTELPDTGSLADAPLEDTSHDEHEPAEGQDAGGEDGGKRSGTTFDSNSGDDGCSCSLPRAKHSTTGLFGLLMMGLWVVRRALRR